MDQRKRATAQEESRSCAGGVENQSMKKYNAALSLCISDPLSPIYVLYFISKGTPGAQSNYFGIIIEHRDVQERRRHGWQQS